MKPLKIGISGVRGIVGETFTPELAVSFAQAFATYLNSGRILICRDTRPSGPMVASAVTAGLLASGCEVIDLGVCPTPSLQLAVRRLNAQGGIAITAGHNATPWNALKFARADGLYLNATQATELLDIYHEHEFEKVTWDRIRPMIESADAVDHHLAILASTFDVASIRRRAYRVAIDCCNGACSALTPRWITELGAQGLTINDDISAPFPHDPEPRQDTMAQVRALVKAGGADFGLVLDADGERLGLVDERARILPEEFTFALAAAVRLSRRPGAVVTNISTSAMVDRIASCYRTPVVRTAVGQAYVSEAVLEHHAVLGGEGNGSVIVPEVQAVPDSSAAIGLILEHLAATQKPLSVLVDELPRLSMIKSIMPVEPNLIYSALQSFRDRVQDECGTEVDSSDGVRIDWPDGWVHVRVSNTESIIRIIAEAEHESRARELTDWARERLRG
ncbi:MAG: phosphoglucosamine mutase [Acidobacteriia bacterium]|nr:phosphoglucosamine mutase [Terriglobia bacterium]